MFAITPLKLSMSLICTITIISHGKLMLKKRVHPGSLNTSVLDLMFFASDLTVVYMIAENTAWRVRVIMKN